MRTTCRSPGIACWWSAGRAEPLVMCVVMQMRWRGACQPRGGPRPGFGGHHTAIDKQDHW